MDWKILIAMAVILRGIEGVLYKKLAANEKPEAPTVTFMLFACIPLLFLVTGFPAAPSLWVFPLVAVVLYTIGNVLFFSAFSGGEVTVLMPLANANPIIVFLLSVPFLKEAPTIAKVIGVSLIVYGSSFLKGGKGLIDSLKALAKDKYVRLCLLAFIVFSFARVVDKLVLNESFPPYSYSFVQFLLPAILVWLYLLINRRGVEVVDLIKRKPTYSIGTGIVAGLRFTLYLLAIAQAQVSVVFSVLSLSVLISMVLAHFFLGESLKGKIIGAIIMIAGASILVMF